MSDPTAADAGVVQSRVQLERLVADDDKKDQLEKIKARVLDMMGEAARNEYMRNGVSRRP